MLTDPYAERMISIDPGLSGTGVVYWDRLGHPSTLLPVRADVLRPLMRQVRDAQLVDEDDLIARTRSLATQIMTARSAPGKALVSYVDLLTVVIEFPEFQASASRMMGWKTGSLQRLTFLVGVLVGMFPATWRIQLVTPSQWKGQLPKAVVEHRMARDYGAATIRRLGIKTHAWDALGIGHWARAQEWMQSSQE
jgi:hypothetical protein